jgi:hypothetical protein
MANNPKISSLKPVVLGDNRRVTLKLIVEGLPVTSSNVLLMPDLPGETPTGPPKPAPAGASPYPNVELSLLNSRRQQVASLFIVEHKERETALTLHLPATEIDGQYTARAEMTRDDEILDVVERAFSLNRTG